MSGQASAWMPLYVGDYLGDTQRLTTEQHGAYLLLILDYWRNGPAPDDDSILQQITKLDKAGWKKHRPALARMFQIEGGEWKHKRIDAELGNATANAERRTDKAKKGAAARWSKQEPSTENGMPEQCPEDAPSMPGALPVECAPQSPSPVRRTPDKSGVPAQRANRLPKGFVVPPDWIAWAKTERSWTSADCRTEAATFVDFWNAKAGRDGTKLDWQATWRNWVRNSRRPSGGADNEGFSIGGTRMSSPC
jgi:uncharacterized protein YdaU (DUF1376 family)